MIHRYCSNFLWKGKKTSRKGKPKCNIEMHRNRVYNVNMFCFNSRKLINSKLMIPCRIDENKYFFLVYSVDFRFT